MPVGKLSNNDGGDEVREKGKMLSKHAWLVSAAHRRRVTVNAIRDPPSLFVATTDTLALQPMVGGTRGRDRGRDLALSLTSPVVSLWEAVVAAAFLPPVAALLSQAALQLTRRQALRPHLAGL